MDAEHIRELFSQFRPVEIRRMFGGAGVVAEGLTFAIVFEGVIYLRANPGMVPELKELGSKPFVYPYAKRARTRKNPDAAPFWRMPEHLYDDPEEAARWARRSLEAAREKKAGKAKSPRKEATSRKQIAAKSAQERPVKNTPRAAAAKSVKKPVKKQRGKRLAGSRKKPVARR